MLGILDRRLAVVVGKGGVGRSTVSAALALAAARAGKKVLVCEMNAKESISALLGAPAVGPHVGRVAEGVEAVDIRPQEAMREYGLMVLRSRTVYDAVFNNRLVRYCLSAVPSLAELVMLGKVLHHVGEEAPGGRRYDLVVLDAPATGHALSLLRLPQVLLDTVPPGPLATQARRMRDLLTDASHTSALVVSLPEEMSVNEAIALDGALLDTVRMHRAGVVVNRHVEPRFSPDELTRLRSSYAIRTPAAAAALAHSSRAELCARHVAKLEAEVELPNVRIPDMPGDSFGREQVDFASVRLEKAL